MLCRRSANARKASLLIASGFVISHLETSILGMILGEEKSGLDRSSRAVMEDGRRVCVGEETYREGCSIKIHTSSIDDERDCGECFLGSLPE